MPAKRLFTSGDEHGLFPDVASAVNYLYFNSTGAPALKASANNALSLARGGTEDEYTGGWAGPTGNTLDDFYNVIAPVYGGGWGTSVAGDDLAAKKKEAILAWKKDFDSIIAGDNYKDFYNNPDIAKAYGNQKPLTWQEYFAEAQKTASANMSDGSKLSGAGLFSFLSNSGEYAQGVNLLSQIEQNYDQYRNDFLSGAAGYTNNEKAQAQIATDTDPRRRQVANYGVSGEPAPTGAAGWGRGNVQSSESFQDQRRRGWAQSGIQGV